jgi:hypothetical protein
MERNLSQVAVINDSMIWASRDLVLQLAGRRNYNKGRGVEGGIKRPA